MFNLGATFLFLPNALRRVDPPPYTAAVVNRFALVLSLIAVAGLSHADIRSELKASRQKLEKAMMAKDVKGVESTMMETMTPDFKFVQGHQTQDRKTFISEFTQSIAMMEKISTSSIRVISLKENGSTATGQIEHMMTGTMKNPDKKIHSVSWTGIFTEGYRKVGGKWKTATMTAGPQKFLQDGKPVKM